MPLTLPLPRRCFLLLAVGALFGIRASAALSEPRKIPVAQAPTVPAATIDLTTWDLVVRNPDEAGASPLTTKAEGVLAVTGKPIGYLVTKEACADYELFLEWRWTGDEAKPNGGVLLHIPAGQPGKVWPHCLQVQLKATDAGSLIPMEGFTIAELPAGAKAVTHRLEAVDAPRGEWNSCRIVCLRDTVSVWINGVLANESTKGSSGSGKIGLQLEGAPFEVRSVLFRQLVERVYR